MAAAEAVAAEEAEAAAAAAAEAAEAAEAAAAADAEPTVLQTASVSATAAVEELVDDNANCPTWAAKGECEKNPAFMAGKCKRSCAGLT